MNDVALRLEDLKKTYLAGTPGEVQVLRGTSVTLNRGEAVALVAPSGAGKSTLLHIAALLDTADEGEVDIAGRPMARASDRQRTGVRRAELGFVYQFHHLLPEFTALENIVLPQLANGVSRTEAIERSRDLLTRVGVADRADHRPAAMSGGEQQRVAFCRPLANRPSILLADEPTGNLDPETSDRAIQMMMELVRETGLAALVATHNMDLAARMDRIVRLTAGELSDA